MASKKMMNAFAASLFCVAKDDRFLFF